MVSGAPADDPPDVLHGTQDAADMFQRLSAVCAPVLVPRNQAATVNAAAADCGLLTPQHAFRRLDSMDAASLGGSSLGQPLTPGSRLDSCGTPPVQGVATTVQLWTEDRRALVVTIHKEKTRDHKNWEPDLLPQEARLQKRLAKLRMEMVVMAGDGNCMFRAISHELWGTPRYHPNVRRKAVRWTRDHADTFAPFLGESFQGYTAAMAREGTWGDELTLRAVSNAYGVIVNVVTSDQHNWFQRYKPEQVMAPREVFLTYIAPVHYNGIRKRTAMR
ncbi:hypothetical protein WJX81_005249 [Elliptochloris bilobata]|uniref:OTU domain-containing protein n=1 Tax=Elliptochloris bilobata TaxID=381761 RepID=A0AAW1QYY5_9CHLO